MGCGVGFGCCIGMLTTIMNSPSLGGGCVRSVQGTVDWWDGAVAAKKVWGSRVVWAVEERRRAGPVEGGRGGRIIAAGGNWAAPSLNASSPGCRPGSSGLQGTSPQGLRPKAFGGVGGVGQPFLAEDPFLLRASDLVCLVAVIQNPRSDLATECRHLCLI